MADIFISYTASDRDWAFWIAKELRGARPHRRTFTNGRSRAATTSTPGWSSATTPPIMCSASFPTSI